MQTDWMPRALGQRIAELAEGARSVLIHAPQEFMVEAAAEAALEWVYDDTPPTIVCLPQDAPDGLGHLLEGAGPLMVVLGREARPVDRQRAFALAERYGIGGGPTSLWVVEATDDLSGEETMLFEVEIGPGHLVLEREDIVAHTPGLALDELALTNLLLETMGIPALIEDTLSAPSRTTASQAWAERLYDQVFTDPVATAVVWFGCVSESALLALLADDALDAPDVERRLLESSFVMYGPSGAEVARILRRSLLELLMDRDPERFTAERTDLVARVAAADSVSGLVRMSLLTDLRGWEALNRLLSTRLHLLNHLGPHAREDYKRALPARVPLSFPHLSTARSVVDGATQRAVPREDPAVREWAELGALVRAQDPTQTTPFIREFIAAFPPMAGAGLPASQQSALRLVGDVDRWLESHVAGQEKAAAGSPDDAAFLIGVAIELYDAALRVGRVDVAHRCVGSSQRLAAAMGPSVRQYSTLWPAVIIRSALLLTRAGHQHQAFEALAEANSYQFASADPSLQETVKVVESFLGLTSRTLGDAAVVDRTHGHERFAPLLAEAQMLRVALVHGTDAALTWGRQTVSRGIWDSAAQWRWWPMFASLSLLESQAGRAELARSWQEHAQLTPGIDLTLRASIALAEGRRQDALTLAESARAQTDAANLSAIVALGVELACQLDDPSRAGRVEAILASQNWGQVLGPVALMPRRAQAAIVERLGAEAQAAPGLLLEEAPAQPAAHADVKLTRRQLELLRLLADDSKTMGEIATEMFVGVETVRSTAKELYRRLGVHDRARAVDRARELGLLRG